MILLTNIGMFSYAAYILHSLQRNVRKGKSNKSYQSQTSSSGNTRECLHRQYSRQLSGKVTSAVSDNLKKQKANIERWVIYELHMHSVWKSQKKVSLKIASYGATFTFWVDKSSLKMPKKVNFGEFLNTWSLLSNSVTRWVNFNRTKIGGKC